MKFSSFLNQFWLMAFVTISVYGQQLPQQPTVKKNQVVASLYLLETASMASQVSINGPAANSIYNGVKFSYFNAKKKTESLFLRPSLRTPNKVLSSELGSITFFSETIIEEKLIKNPLAVTQIPEDWRQVFLIVYPSQAGATLPFQILPIRDDSTELPLNHAKFINLGGKPIALQVHGSPKQIQPNEQMTIDYSADTEKGLKVKIGAEVRGKVRLVYDDILPAVAGSRGIFLIIPAGDGLWKILDLADNGEDPFAQMSEVTSPSPAQ